MKFLLDIRLLVSVYMTLDRNQTEKKKKKKRKKTLKCNKKVMKDKIKLKSWLAN